MKNLTKLLVVLFALTMAFTACKKEAVTEQQDSQITYELGMKFLPADEYAKIPVAETPKSLKAVSASVNLGTMPVGNQGGEGSCVAWGTTYAGRSITWVKTHPAAYLTSVNIFSPEYVYNQIKISDCASGAYVKTGLDLLKSQGACLWNTMPYTDANCSLFPSDQQKAEAANYKISGYATVPITTAAIKAQLDAGNPVVVGGPVDRTYMNLAPNAVLTKRKGSLGGHCYCVVGYDDAKGAFKFQNSWGTTWATAGYGWIGYSYITQWWTEAYVMYNVLP